MTYITYKTYITHIIYITNMIYITHITNITQIINLIMVNIKHKKRTNKKSIYNFLYIKLTNKYYQKKKQHQKETCEKYQNLSEVGKNKN